MPNQRKVYIPWYDSSVGSLFKKHFFTVTDELQEADIVCFTGGEDVDPSLYLHKTHYSTYSNPSRDKEEYQIYNRAKDKNIPMVGICRGGQLLNVLEGGTMYQDVTNHANAGHRAIIDGDMVYVSSTHHQMMNPGRNAIIIGVGVGTNAKRVHYSVADKMFITEEPKHGQLDIEVLAYGDVLCFQPHPEYSLHRPEFLDCAQKFFSLIEKVCFKKETV